MAPINHSTVQAPTKVIATPMPPVFPGSVSDETAEIQQPGNAQVHPGIPAQTQQNVAGGNHPPQETLEHADDEPVLAQPPSPLKRSLYGWALRN
ncbi:unnamed protein product [Rhizoctonia solani]|uniref:Uncharacterized protein n=1 Tax=Rhizoctonia solani TaxID=456999 RepID=A0A8H3H988_9AGAM|nr:unnamed protein product [Rhizoctonia solani]